MVPMMGTARLFHAVMRVIVSTVIGSLKDILPVDFVFGLVSYPEHDLLF